MVIAISDRIGVTRQMIIPVPLGGAMNRPLIQEDDIDEIFFTDELYCNFCADMIPRPDYSGEHPVTLPPCNRCTGLIYAMKSKVYFVVN